MKKLYYLSVLAIVAMMMATGCEPQGFEASNDGMVGSIGVKEAVVITGSPRYMQITLNDTAKLQLNVVILPQNAKNKTVTFENKNHSLMTVSATGFITAKAVGRDTLTISATDGSGTSIRFIVNITDHIIKATGINVASAGLNFPVKMGGNAFDLSAFVSVVPAATSNKAVTYTSNDETIATVTATGLVSAVSPGVTTITIRTIDGSNLSIDCNVTVQDVVRREVDADRAGWTVTTQTATNYGNVTDGATGLPEHMFDDNATTFLSLVKPGKSYNPIPAQASTFIPSFTVDMKTQQTFEYIRWQHRSGNAYNYLRVFAINIEGSNDGTAFTPINTSGMVWIPNKAGYAGSVGMADTETYRISIPESTFRYVKVSLAMWSDIYSGQNPDYPGAGAASGSTMQVSEFGVGKIVIE